MSQSQSQTPSGAAVSVMLEIVPLEEEEDDLDTMATVGHLQAEVQQDIARLNDYTVSTLPGSKSGARGLDLVLLITFAGATIAAYKDLLTSLFQAVSTVVEVLAKRGKIQEVEIIADGKTVILRDVSKKTARELIEVFEAQHPGATERFTPATTVQVKARASKKSKRHPS